MIYMIDGHDWNYRRWTEIHQYRPKSTVIGWKFPIMLMAGAGGE